MKSIWKWSRPLQNEREYLVLASSIPPKSRRSTWRLFRGARAVRKQLRDTDGVIGFALLARPLRKEYATLSVWTDEDALASFAATNPHRELMRTLSYDMGPTKFERWTIRGSEGRPSWNDALNRLAKTVPTTH
jgi:heme-degrading monooxygenase HmoA